MAVECPDLYEVAVLIDEIVFLIETVGLVTPDFTIDLSFVPAVDSLDVGIVLVDYCLGIGECEHSIDSKSVVEAVVVVDGDFESLADETAEVRLRRACSESGRNAGSRNNHVLGLPVVPVECDSEVTVEEAGVKSEVKSGDVLPSN